MGSGKFLCPAQTGGGYLGSYQTRAEAKSDIYSYIEVFYNRQRRHSYTNQMSPERFESDGFIQGNSREAQNLQPSERGTGDTRQGYH